MLKNNTLTYISLFSSAGVGCYGFKQNGFVCVATNEIIERRLNIQKLNDKCIYDTGYILGDIQDSQIKAKIFHEVDRFKKIGNDRIDVLIATPPCQGMSVANHKKKINEIKRNSLVVESVDLINKVNPRFFILENVASFYKTGCVDFNNNILSIGDMIENNLAKKYSIYNKVINFKDYGANSSRTRTLVIGVCKELYNHIMPLELFPSRENPKSLKDIIGYLKSLSWNEIDENDFFHKFRIYPEHMREWIRDIKEGESAFDNKEDCKKPHQIVNGKIKLNVLKNGDKYKRQKWCDVAPCIHTRNDQLASQNTIHPKDDRVFSLRELMIMMNISNDFKWLPFSLDELNRLSNNEKYKLYKQNEINIRQSIGEAVPTIIFNKIAKNIKDCLQKEYLNKKQIKEIVSKNNLSVFDNLKKFITKNTTLSISSIANLTEFCNTNKIQNSAYFTNKFIVNEIIKTLPEFSNNEEIAIVEPSVGCGNFLLGIFHKYSNIKKVHLKLVDIDSNVLNIVELLYKNQIPKNFEVKYICGDFLQIDFNKVDLVIGNPPFRHNTKNINLAKLFLEKSLNISKFVSMVMPKNLLNTNDYLDIRIKLQEKGVSHIIDFGEKGFDGVLIETINITTGKTKEVQIKSMPLNLKLNQKQSYIFSQKLPYWIIYRNDFFDKIFDSLEFGIFDVFRDRQLTNSNTSSNKSDIRVIKSRNIDDNGNIINIKNYDSYINKDELNNFKVSDFLDRDDVYLTPNMTYNPRLAKKQKGYIVNGSVAILIPKQGISLTKSQMDYISSDEFRNFYKIARNYQTRTLNVDKLSCFWFGRRIENGR